MKLALTFAKRLWLLAMLLIFGLCVSSVISVLLSRVLADNPTAALRITAVAQNLLAFILPAILVALLSTRLPAELLAIKTAPTSRRLLLSLALIVVSIPAINCFATLGELIPWPQALLDAEKSAQANVETILGAPTPLNLIVNILIVGLLTGVGEELFFRGALQRLLLLRPMNLHAAIWIAAIVFSLMHGQVVGFFARTILGAMLGYMAAWTASTWTAIAAHALNNSLVVVVMWMGWNPNDYGMPRPVAVALSVIATLCLLRLLYQSRFKSSGI